MLSTVIPGFSGSWAVITARAANGSRGRPPSRDPVERGCPQDQNNSSAISSNVSGCDQTVEIHTG